MRTKRLLQFAVGAIFAAVAALLFGAGVHDYAHAGGQAFLPMILPLVMGLAAVGVLEAQIRGMKQRGARVLANVERIARTLFDAPAAVRPGYDLSVTATPGFAALATQLEQDLGFTTDGTCNGIRTSAASHVSTIGRQMGELQHVYSHVVVDVLGFEGRFVLTKEGVGSKLARATGMVHDAKVGDATFDATWNVDTDDDLARAVLDDDVRARIMALESKVGSVSQNFGVGTMSIILTRHGLALRWPGEMNESLATYVRDLLLDVRGKLLAHVDRKAVRVATDAAGYRLAADDAPPPSEEAKRAVER